MIQSAAPADYRAEEIADQKIKKKDGEAMVLRRIENPDVAATLGKAKLDSQVFVGFAAETQNVLEHARKKLIKKNLDMIVANDVMQAGAGFDVDTNIVTLITQEEMTSLPLMQKSDVADHILTHALQLKKRK